MQLNQIEKSVPIFSTVVVQHLQYAHFENFFGNFGNFYSRPGTPRHIVTYLA